MSFQEIDMSRRRLQQKGDLWAHGGWWKLRWRMDTLRPDGSLGRQWTKAIIIGPASGNMAGLDPWTEKQARRHAWENFLSKIDRDMRTPQSIVTVREFVERKFQPEHIALLKSSGRAHYGFMLEHVVHAIGGLQLREVQLDHVQQAVSGMLAKSYSVPRGKDAKGKPLPPLIRRYSVQTARHVKNVISAVFAHAIRVGWHPGPNPAALARLPEMVRKQAHALSFDQVRALLPALSSPEREMALVMVLTSMNVAEVCGLQWRHVNLSDGWKMLDAEAIPPHHLAVRQQWYRGAYGTLKQKSRRRNLPIPSILATTLEKLLAASEFQGPADPVFAGPRNGHPVDEHNAMARHLKPVGVRLGLPWISWHVFRRTHTTLADQLGASFADRMALMGHADMRMTALYTLPDQERRRQLMEAMVERIFGASKGRIQ